MNRPKRIAFFTLGSFSNTNARVLEQLRVNFPGYYIDAIDVREARLFHAPRVIGIALRAALEYRSRVIANPLELRAAMQMSTGFFDAVRRFVTTTVDPRRYSFTFQTQSLFDASLPGVPHFVYTDHTHLANLTYPAFDRRKLACGEWIERERSIYEHATSVFTMSSHVSRSLTDDYGCCAAQVQCVGVGANVEETTDESGELLQKNPREILFVGLDWRRKGGPCLLEAFRAVQASYKDARLTIAGCRPTLPSGLNARAIGRCTPEEVRRLYQQAEVFCMPSRIEPFGIVYVEAAAFGLPVVASRIGAGPDIIQDGESGFLVEPDSPADVARALLFILGDRERAVRMGQCGRQFVTKRYSWSATGSRIGSAISSRIGVAQ